MQQGGEKHLKGSSHSLCVLKFVAGNKLQNTQILLRFFNFNRRQGHPANCHYHIIIIIIIIIADEKLQLDTRILKRITGFISVGHVPSAVPGNTSRQPADCNNGSDMHAE
jgi:hypothetical protein